GADRRDGPRGDARLRALPALPLRAPAGRAPARARPRGGARPACGARPAARLGPDGDARRDDGRERLLPDDAVLLLLLRGDPRARAAGRLRPPRRRPGLESPRAAGGRLGRAVAERAHGPARARRRGADAALARAGAARPGALR